MKRVLIANDSFEGMQTALEKAALVEHYTGATIEVAEVIFDAVVDADLPEPEKARLIEAYIAAERNGLRDLLGEFKDRIAWSEPAVLWGKHADEAINAEAQTRGADLIIKPIAHHSLFTDALHLPLDWRLIRTAAVPVLISKSSGWSTGGNVLAAVDVSDPEHSDLNERILGTAATLSGILDARLHAVSVYPDLGQTVSGYQVAMDFEGIKEDMREARETSLAELVDDSVERHVLEGKPAKMVASLADQLNATLVVVGTAGRSGLKKLALGNTSEAMLGRLSADVVTVR